MFQVPSTTMVGRQAAIAGVEWLEVRTSGETPDDIHALEAAIRGLDIDGFVSGALRALAQSRTRTAHQVCPLLEVDVAAAGSRAFSLRIHELPAVRALARFAVRCPVHPLVGDLLVHAERMRGHLES